MYDPANPGQKVVLAQVPGSYQPQNFNPAGHMVITSQEQPIGR